MNQAMPEELEVMSAEHWGLALREVQRAYRELNASLFASSLRVPRLSWSEGTRTYGSWSPSERCLLLARGLIPLGWGVLLEVLKHEMAHQYVDEVLGASLGEGPHGETFRRVCTERGIDARASSDPEAMLGAAGQEASRDEDPEALRRRAALQRVEHLLALAQSDNQFEAEAAMVKARRLMLKYNLEEALRGAEGKYAFRHLGKPTGRRMAWERALGTLIGEHFFVQVIIVPVYRPVEGKRASVFEACGAPHNLETAAYAYDFLYRTASTLWKRHKKKRCLRSDADKQSYLFGVVMGFGEKLEKEARRSQQEGLVWAGDPALVRYFRRRHPHIRQVGGRGKVRDQAFSAGHQAGGRIVLHRGVESGSRAPLRGLLTGRAN
jgi:hypothetical protein